MVEEKALTEGSQPQNLVHQGLLANPRKEGQPQLTAIHYEQRRQPHIQLPMNLTLIIFFFRK